MIRRLLFLFITSFLFGKIPAQIQFIRHDSIEVYANSQQLLFPWAGGINYAQFSEIDFNQDGIKDLFVFDRAGNKITTYINNGTANQMDYVLAPEYIEQFPELHDWVLLRDFNCDGKMDIFTSYGSLNPGIAVWENTSTGPALQFQAVTLSLESNMTPNSTNQNQFIFISPYDVPAIRDIDGDTDLDILVFDNSGVYIVFHRNMSQENYGTCDSLDYRLESQCWGEITENTLNSTLNLNNPCSDPPVNENIDASVLHSVHNGSCLECLNTDGDSDQDILIGDLANKHISYGRNDSNNTFSHIGGVDVLYPSYNQTTEMNLFVCGYHLDVNNDGKQDILMCPNAANVSENFKSVWYYQNIGANDSVVLSFMQNNFLQDNMIETGQGAYPRFFDYDNDGDEDLFIGNYGYFSDSTLFPAKIALYKNIGNATFPTFSLITDDFAGIHASNINFTSIIPAFGDLDGDGDADLVVGTGTGKLQYYRKDPGPNDNFVLAQSNYMGIDVGNYAAPQLVDVDRDGLLDLLIGEETGVVNYYHNSGTASVPNFVFVSGFWGSVNVQQPTFTTGFSIPYLWDNNGAYVLLVGSERGWLYRYDNIDGNLAGNFTLTDSMYVSTHQGLRIAPWMADLNNDTIPDLIIGNYAGGVSFFKGTTPSSVEDPASITTFNLYPNPAKENVTVVSNLPANELPATISIWSASGQKITETVMSFSSTSLDLTHFSKGVYIIEFRTASGNVAYRKLIRQ
jgi:hypothetical protein